MKKHKDLVYLWDLPAQDVKDLFSSLSQNDNFTILFICQFSYKRADRKTRLLPIMSTRYDLSCIAKNWDWAACTGCWLPNSLANFVTVILSYGDALGKGSKLTYKNLLGSLYGMLASQFTCFLCYGATHFAVQFIIANFDAISSTVGFQIHLLTLLRCHFVWTSFNFC